MSGPDSQKDLKVWRQLEQQLEQALHQHVEMLRQVREHIANVEAGRKIESSALERLMGRPLPSKYGQLPTVQKETRAKLTKGGRPPSADWTVVRNEVFRLMDYHDDFIPGEPEWNALARLDERITTFCEQKGWFPGRTQRLRHLAAYVEEWRVQKAGN